MRWYHILLCNVYIISGTTFCPQSQEIQAKGVVTSALFLHNMITKQFNRSLDVMDPQTENKNILCHVSPQWHDGRLKNTHQIIKEIEFHAERLDPKTLPLNTFKAPNNVWIRCQGLKKSRFSFDTKGNLMLDEQPLIQTFSDKRYDCASFVGKEIVLKSLEPNILVVSFFDWGSKPHPHYINIRKKQIFKTLTEAQQ